MYPPDDPARPCRPQDQFHKNLHQYHHNQSFVHILSNLNEQDLLLFIAMHCLLFPGKSFQFARLLLLEECLCNLFLPRVTLVSLLLLSLSINTCRHLLPFGPITNFLPEQKARYWFHINYRCQQCNRPRTMLI